MAHSSIQMDPEAIIAFQEALREILEALDNCATRLQRLEKIAEYYVMYITDYGQQFIMHYGDRLREILKDRIATYRVQFSQDYARTNAEQAAEDWLLNILTELERETAPTIKGAAPTIPIRGAAPTTPIASEAGTSEAGTSEAGTSEAGTSEAGTGTSTSEISYIITLPPPLTNLNTNPNILIAPINQTLLQL